MEEDSLLRRNFTALCFVVLFLFVDRPGSCPRFIFPAVLTVGLMAGLPAFFTLSVCNIISAWHFSVFCHSYHLFSCHSLPAL